MFATIQKNLTIIFACLLPIIAMFAPLAMVPIFIIIGLYPTYYYILNANYKNLHKNNLNKLIIIFFIYSSASCLWAIDPGESFSLLIRMALIFIIAVALISYSEKHNQDILKYLLIGIIITIIIANIEILTNAIIFKNLRFFFDNYFHNPPKIRPMQENYIVELNRGSSILSIMSWAVICYLFMHKKNKAAILLLIASFCTIIRLESMSTSLSFAIASIIFPAIYYHGNKLLKPLSIIAVFAVFIVVITTSLMDAKKLVGNFPVIPGAASNMRLYIYDYTAKQALQKSILGWGFNSSRSYPVNESDYVDNGRNPLPLHPHNNTLQIWLELGLIGTIFFAAFLYLILQNIRKSNSPNYLIAASTALFTNYFVMGQTGYGIWQNWWVAGGILAVFFLLLNNQPNQAQNN